MCYQIFSNSLRRNGSVIKQKKQPSWISRYNFLSLLNLPDLVRRYGSLRNIWEGGMDGEGILKIVKKELQCGLIYEWQTWSIDNIMKKQTLRELTNNYASDKNPDDIIIKTNNNYKIYATKEDVQRSFCQRKPISAMRYRIDKNSLSGTYVCYRDQKKVFCLEVKTVENTGITVNHMNYYSIYSNETEAVELGFRLEGEVIGILLLPILHLPKNNKKHDDKYCVISSDWNEYK